MPNCLQIANCQSSHCNHSSLQFIRCVEFIFRTLNLLQLHFSILAFHVWQSKSVLQFLSSDSGDSDFVISIFTGCETHSASHESLWRHLGPMSSCRRLLVKMITISYIVKYNYFYLSIWLLVPAFDMWFPWSLESYTVYTISFIFHAYAGYLCCIGE